MGSGVPQHHWSPGDSASECLRSAGPLGDGWPSGRALGGNVAQEGHSTLLGADAWARPPWAWALSWVSVWGDAIKRRSLLCDAKGHPRSGGNVPTLQGQLRNLQGSAQAQRWGPVFRKWERFQGGNSREEPRAGPSQLSPGSSPGPSRERGLSPGSGSRTGGPS